MEAQSLPLVKIPNKIHKATILIAVYLLFEVIKSVLYKLSINQKLEPKTLLYGLFAILLLGFFAYKIRQRKNWARIIILVLFVLKTISLPWVIVGEFIFSPVIGVLSIIQLLLVIMVLIFLFNKESDPWFKGPELTREPIKETSSPQELSKTLWFWLIIPLAILGYGLGCNLNTGGNVFAGALMIFGPFIFGLGLIILLILLLVGLKNKNKALILVSKIGLLLISFPASYTAGVIFCH